MTQRSSLEQADASLRRHGKTFTWARRFLGRRHAERATLLYAFCRYLDDLADELAEPSASREALAAVAADLRHGDSAHPLVGAVLDQFGTAWAPRAAALALVDGVTRDLSPVAFGGERELLRYCYHVAGVVGIMMCCALDQKDPEALPFAIDLGIAMQLTNIARDVYEDAEMGRRYLPAGAVADADAAAIVALAPGTRSALQAARTALLDRAEHYYRSGKRGLAFLPLRSRLAILVAAENYRAIGVRVRALGDRVEERAVVPGVQKAWISVRALLASAVRPSFWLRPTAHEAALHRHLDGLDGADPGRLAVG